MATVVLRDGTYEVHRDGCVKTRRATTVYRNHQLKAGMVADWVAQVVGHPVRAAAVRLEPCL